MAVCCVQRARSRTTGIPQNPGKPLEEVVNEHTPGGFLGHFKAFTGCRRELGLWNALGQCLWLSLQEGLPSVNIPRVFWVSMPLSCRQSEGSVDQHLFHLWNKQLESPLLILIASPTRRLATCLYRSAHFRYLHIFGAVTGAVICGLSPWSGMTGQAVNWLRVLFVK